MLQRLNKLLHRLPLPLMPFCRVLLSSRWFRKQRKITSGQVSPRSRSGRHRRLYLEWLWADFHPLQLGATQPTAYRPYRRCTATSLSGALLRKKIFLPTRLLAPVPLLNPSVLLNLAYRVHQSLRPRFWPTLWTCTLGKAQRLWMRNRLGLPRKLIPAHLRP